MKTLWIVGGGFETVPGIERAQAMGLRVVVSDANPAAPGLAHADVGVVASTYDASATLAAIRAYQAEAGAIDGITCIAADVPLTVAHAASALGLPGIPVRSAQLSMDKLAMKDALSGAGLAVPAYGALRDARDLSDWRDREGSVVVKPVDSRGARGVSRVEPSTDPEWAFAEALRHSPSGRVMVESFVAGPQVSTEGCLVEGRLHPVAANDRNYEYMTRFAPFFIENGGSAPSHLTPSERDALSKLALEAGRALGVVTGVVKGDMVLSSGGPKIIEVALRLSGGFFCTHQIPIATGVDLVGAAIRMALGERPRADALTPTRDRGVAIRYLFPEPGIVERIEGVEAVSAGAGIELVRLDVAPGDRVGDPSNHTERAGFVLASGRDAREAIARAEAGVSSIRVETSASVDSRGVHPTSAPA